MSQKTSAWNDTLKTIVYAVLLAVFFRSVAYEPFHIPSGSMKSTLLVGDYLFVSKYSYGYSRYSFPLGLKLFEGRIGGRAPERGDIVVFRPPNDPRRDFIKRLVGLPGDRIQVIGGIVYINGSAVPRRRIEDFVDMVTPTRAKAIARYVETLPGGKTITVLDERQNGDVDNTAEYVVPPKHYFMMGDNRDNSRDSRYIDEVGYVPEENLVGRAEMIFFSTDGSARFFQFWKWFGALRDDRLFKPLG